MVDAPQSTNNPDPANSADPAIDAKGVPRGPQSRNVSFGWAASERVDLARELTSAQRRNAALEAQLETVVARNKRLTTTLADARSKLVQLREELNKLASPPNAFGTVVAEHEDGTVDVVTAGRKFRVGTAPGLTALQPGRQVLLNEAMNVVAVLGPERVGEIVTCKEVLEGGDRALVLARADDERVVPLADSLADVALRAGDALLLDPRSGFVYERIPKSEVEELVLEEIPDVNYSDIGGLSGQIEMIRDAVELPFLHADLFAEHRLTAPKGILLYGPPGCGKTMIAKAVAASLARKIAERRAHAQADDEHRKLVLAEGAMTRGGKDGASQHDRSANANEAAGAQRAHDGQDGARSYFLNIKGPELLNKYVGETERHIRLVFQRAREKASAGTPVIVFFDEMDSLFRTRGSGVSSDVENTIVPQLLSEIDGVERLANVIVIGASNREDMIDPAILRPGRLDVKIKIERPDAQAAAEILSKYLTADLPLHADDLAEHRGSPEATCAAMIELTVERMYAQTPQNQFLEVTYANGDKETLYFKDFNSGAMLENIVARAKKSAIKAYLESGQKGIRVSHLLSACVDEFRENEDLPNTTNPDDWARISGKKGERIVFVRTLIAGKSGTQAGRSIETITNTGQYL